MFVWKLENVVAKEPIVSKPGSSDITTTYTPKAPVKCSKLVVMEWGNGQVYMGVQKKTGSDYTVTSCKTPLYKLRADCVIMIPHDLGVQNEGYNHEHASCEFWGCGVRPRYGL